MKALIVLILLAVSLFFETKNKTTVAPQISPLKDTASIDTIIFLTQIQPILVNHCSPCHFTGGKMYDRLPFDKDTTIIGHEAGVLRRIKDEKENALIKQFIQQQMR